MFCANCGNALDTRNQTADGMIRCPVCGMNQPVPAQAYEQPVRRYRQTTGSYTPPQETYAPPADTYAPPAERYTPPVPQQRQAYTPPTPSYTPQFVSPVTVVTNTAPAPAPVKTISTGRRVVGIFSLIVGLLALFLDIFCLIHWVWIAGPGTLIIAFVVSLVAVILSGIGKGGCHIAGMILSIIALVGAVVMFAIFGGIEALVTGRLDSIFNFFSGSRYYW